MLRITGGKVYDPKNGVNGAVRDVCIAAAARSPPDWTPGPCD